MSGFWHTLWLVARIVKKNVGYLSNKINELISAVEDSNSYSSANCHDYAMEMFNSNVMAISYIEKYEKVLSNESLNIESLKLIEKQEQKFLNWID